MPPKIKIKEDAILDVSLEIIRTIGIEGLNAREFARILGCSIQPVFLTFQKWCSFGVSCNLKKQMLP